VIHGGADNIGGDETITIGYSDHHHDDSNDKVNTRPNSWLMHHFTHVWNSSQCSFSIQSSKCSIPWTFNHQKGESKMMHQQRIKILWRFRRTSSWY